MDEKQKHELIRWLGWRAERYEDKNGPRIFLRRVSTDTLVVKTDDLDEAIQAAMKVWEVPGDLHIQRRIKEYKNHVLGKPWPRDDGKGG